MEDLRITRTKKAIEDAMLALIEIKGFTNVRLTDVAKQAMVNRNTIYLHYESKEAIVMSIINRIFTDNFVALDAARALTGRANKAKLKEIFTKMLKLINENSDLYRIVLIDQNLSGYLNISVNKIKDILYHTLKPTNRNRLGVEYIVSGIYGTITRWIIYATGTLDETVNVLTDFTIQNVRHLLR